MILICPYRETCSTMGGVCECAELEPFGYDGEHYESEGYIHDDWGYGQ